MTKPAKSLTAKQAVAYLTAAGWKPDPADKTRWADPRYKGSKPEWNSHDTGWAVKQQFGYDRFDKGLPIYAVCAAQDRYGYLLRRCVAAEGPWVTVWRHHDEETVQEWAEKLNASTMDLPVFATDTHVYPYILVLKEKHGERYFAAPNLDTFRKVCLYVVRLRAAEGYWYDYSEASKIEKPTLTKEQVAALPDGRVKQVATEEWTTYERVLGENDSALREKALLDKALKGDGEAAAAFMRARKSGEYEGWELMELENPEDETL